MKFRLLSSIFIICLLSACSNPADRINRLVSQSIEECKATDATFHEVTLFDGSKERILRSVCDMEVGPSKVFDKIRSTTDVGPYTFYVNVDRETGVWALNSVSWDVMGQISNLRAAMDPSEDQRARLDALYAEALEVLPQEEWFYVQRLQNAIELRKKLRVRDENPVAIGEDVEKLLQDVVTFADQHDRTEVAEDARLRVIEMQHALVNRFRTGIDGAGASDDWLESAIRQARQEGNRDDERKYREELEERRVARVETLARYERQKAETIAIMCEMLDELGESDDPRAVEVRSSVECAAEESQ